jgi:glycosyltransferase involved in cell wall biosynthesis
MTSPLAARHVLMVGVNYWPEATGIAPYTTALAEHLARRGARVTVLTGMPHYPAWRVFPGYGGRLRRRERVRGVEVWRFHLYVPTRQTVVRRALFEVSFAAHLLACARPARPDAVIGIVPNLGAGLLAAVFARRAGAPFGLLFQDLCGSAAAQSGLPGGGPVAHAVRRLEWNLARRAAAVAVVAPGFQRYLEAGGVAAARIVRVRNFVHLGPARRAPAAVRAALGLPANAWLCLHAGNMGYKQDLGNVLACARLALRQAPRLHFALVGDGSQRRALEARAAGLANVSFLPLQPEAEFPDVLAAADVLLVNQRPSVTDMSLPGKLTAYFAAGRPVVAAVADDSETAAEVRAAGAGPVVAPGDPAALLAALQALAADRERSARCGRQAQAYARAHLSAERALTGLEAFVARVLAGAAASVRPARRRAMRELSPLF